MKSDWMPRSKVGQKDQNLEFDEQKYFATAVKFDFVT